MKRKKTEKILLTTLILLLLVETSLISGCKSKSETSETSKTVASGYSTTPKVGTMKAIEPSYKYINVSPEEAMKLIQENRGNNEFVILDVRTPSEYKEGHIEDSLLLNFYDSDFKEKLNDLDKGKTYLIYCRSGSRSGRTLTIMEKLKFRHVYNLSGGIINWKSKNLPLQSDQ